MSKTNGAAPPAHLSKEARDWWKAVTAQYAVADPHHFKLLRAACEAWDRLQQARGILAKEGVTYRDRFGAPRAHPALAVERDSRIGFARLVRQLGFDDSAPAPDGFEKVTRAHSRHYRRRKGA